MNLILQKYQAEAIYRALLDLNMIGMSGSFIRSYHDKSSFAITQCRSTNSIEICVYNEEDSLTKSEKYIDKEEFAVTYKVQ